MMNGVRDCVIAAVKAAAFFPILAVLVFLYAAGTVVKNLDHIDPMPWNQAILISVAFSALVILALVK